MKYKVFHIVTHFDIGGSETVALNISKSNNQNYEFHIVEVVRGHGKYSDSLINDMKQHNIKYHRSPLSTNFILGAILFPFWFWKIHIKYKPNIYHTHTESPDVAMYLFYHLFGFLINKKRTKIFRTIHNTKLWKNKHFIGNIIEHFFLKHKSNIAISIPVKEIYLKNFNFYNKEIPVILNGIEEKEQKPFKDLPQDKINILFAGRIVKQKGIDTLSDVICQLNKNKNNFLFHIIGEGPLEEDLKNKLADFNNVHFYGNVYNLASYLNSFDYLFMPSIHEGLSMLSIESSFAKLPVIINSCEGLVDTVPETWPLKVNNNNINQYIKIFESINKESKYKYGDFAYNYVKTKFGISLMQNNYLKLYDK